MDKYCHFALTGVLKPSSSDVPVSRSNRYTLQRTKLKDTAPWSFTSVYTPATTPQIKIQNASRAAGNSRAPSQSICIPPPLPSQEAAIMLTRMRTGDFLQLCIRVTMSYLLSHVWLLLFNIRSVRALPCVQQFIPFCCV